MAEDFTLDGYRSLLAAFRKRGYMAVRYENTDPAARHLVLRHDLDMSIQAAVPLAEIEAELGVTAHYFVLLRSEMYNPWTPAARADLGRVAGLGHRIGLHLDAALYGDDTESLDAAAHEECAVLETIVSAPVEVISFHRPARALQGRDGTLAGRCHAYERRFFRDMGYCSDSRGGWRHGNPLAHEATRAGRALQLLTHPIWWVGRGTPAQRLDDFLDRRLDRLDRELAAQCSTHVPRRARR